MVVVLDLAKELGMPEQVQRGQRGDRRRRPREQPERSAATGDHQQLLRVAGELASIGRRPRARANPAACGAAPAASPPTIRLGCRRRPRSARANSTIRSTPRSTGERGSSRNARKPWSRLGGGRRGTRPRAARAARCDPHPVSRLMRALYTTHRRAFIAQARQRGPDQGPSGAGCRVAPRHGGGLRSDDDHSSSFTRPPATAYASRSSALRPRVARAARPDATRPGVERPVLYVAGQVTRRALAGLGFDCYVPDLRGAGESETPRPVGRSAITSSATCRR